MSTHMIEAAKEADTISDNNYAKGINRRERRKEVRKMRAGFDKDKTNTDKKAGLTYKSKRKIRARNKNKSSATCTSNNISSSTNIVHNSENEDDVSCSSSDEEFAGDYFSYVKSNAELAALIEAQKADIRAQQAKHLAAGRAARAAARMYKQ